jgi:phage gp36-like protein
MPLYISQASMQERYGEEALNFDADDDADGELDAEKVARAIKDAEAEVNSYVAVAYTLPLPGVVDMATPESNTSVPPELVRPCVDIAFYRLCAEHDRLTKERRRRYDDAVKWLEKLAARTVTLTVADLPTSSTVTRYGPDRVMTRCKLDGLV